MTRGGDDVRVCSSDPAAWVEEHGEAMYRFALLRVRHPETAEELVQEALLSALNARRTFSQRSSERTWLIGILKHKLIDHYRRTANRQRTESADSSAIDDNAFNHRGLWRARVARWPGAAADNIETAEFWEAFRTCVQRLPEPVANAFCLREVEQMTSEEVCQVLGISPSNLWTQLHRARLSLRECLERKWFNKRVSKKR